MPSHFHFLTIIVCKLHQRRPFLPEIHSWLSQRTEIDNEIPQLIIGWKGQQFFRAGSVVHLYLKLREWYYEFIRSDITLSITPLNVICLNTFIKPRPPGTLAQIESSIRRGLLDLWDTQTIDSMYSEPTEMCVSSSISFLS